MTDWVTAYEGVCYRLAKGHVSVCSSPCALARVL